MNIIQGPYFHDIQFQPQALAATFAALDGLVMPNAPLASQGPLILTGMGASLHALVPLQLKLVAAGFAPLLMETGELIHHASQLLRPGAVVVAVSQSGRSAETIGLLDQVPAGVQVVGISNDSASPLAQRCSHALITHAGPEATVSCKTYVSTLMMLEWLGAHWVGEDLAAVRPELAQAPSAVADYVRAWPQHVEIFSEALSETALLYYAGRGPSCAAAQAAGLITKEASHFPAEGFSSAAFRHGPLEMVGPQVFLVVFEGLPPTAALNARLVQDVLHRGGRAALCGAGGDAGFALPTVPPRLLPMVEILVPQMITLALAARLQMEAGRFAHATKVTAVQ